MARVLLIWALARSTEALSAPSRLLAERSGFSFSGSRSRKSSPHCALLDSSGGHLPPGSTSQRFDGDDSDDNGNQLAAPAFIMSVICKAYSTALDRQPMLTKSLTSSFVGGMGDLIAQLVSRPKQPTFDTERFLAVCLDGLLVSGPGLHLGYSWLERIVPCSGGGRLRNCAIQLTVDEFVFDPCFVAAFFFSTGIAEGQRPLEEILPTLKRQYFPTVKGAFVASLAFTPVQFISFRYLPVKCRVLVVNLCDTIWYSAVSLGRHVERVAHS